MPLEVEQAFLIILLAVDGEYDLPTREKRLFRFAGENALCLEPKMY